MVISATDYFFNILHDLSIFVLVEVFYLQKYVIFPIHRICTHKLLLLQPLHIIRTQLTLCQHTQVYQSFHLQIYIDICEHGKRLNFFQWRGDI